MVCHSRTLTAAGLGPLKWKKVTGDITDQVPENDASDVCGDAGLEGTARTPQLWPFTSYKYL